jgi:glycosyltransferase involved in cell wall biosynthesis
MYNNIHIVMNSFSHGSRILRETDALAKSAVGKIYIVGIHGKGLEEYEEIGGGRTIRRVRLMTKDWPKRTAIQVLKYLEFCLRSILFTRGKQIRLINVHSVDLLPLGVLLKWMLRAKLVYDAHELETEKFGMGGIRQRFAKAIERACIKSADLVIVVSKGIEDWYRKTYGLENIVTLLNSREFIEPRRSRILHQTLNIPANKRIVIYQGALSCGRGIERLLESFAERKSEDYVLVCMGYGELAPLIKEQTFRRGNVYLKDAVKPDVVPEYTAAADVGVSYIENASLNDRFCLPNKLFEYIGAGLPVIVNDAPEQRRLVEEGGIGVVLNELTGNSLEVALRTIEGMEQSQLGANLRRVAMNSSWNRQAEVMIEAYRRHVFQGQ